jgi:hydrocephalus-inducing protein
LEISRKSLISCSRYPSFSHPKGSVSPRVFTIKGRVVGPTFNFDIPHLDFGSLAYGFLSSKTFSLNNTSHIPMTFRLRVPDEESEECEFVVTPEYGSIPPMGVQTVQVDFKPARVGAYKNFLVVDVESVGPNMQALEIVAYSSAPLV